MVGRDILMREGLCRGDALSGVEDKHLLEKIDRCGEGFLRKAREQAETRARTDWVVAVQLLAERHAFALG